MGKMCPALFMAKSQQLPALRNISSFQNQHKSLVSTHKPNNHLLTRNCIDTVKVILGEWRGATLVVGRV